MERAVRLVQVLQVAVLFGCISAVTTSPCSPANLNSDPSNCLSSIVTSSQDKNLFWFGTPYSARCPNPWASLDCFNYHPYRADSLVTRVFGPGYSFNESLVTKYLNVTFETGTGTYSGCGNTWTVTESRRLELDPTVSTIYKPWSVRKRPMMTWEANQNELYTIIVYDAGSLVNHGLIINIPGNNVSAAEIFKDYHGPMKSTPTPNVYSFWLFKQSGRIQMSEEWRKLLSNSMAQYNNTDAVEYLNLTGPVGVNWMRVTMDPYAMQNMINIRLLYTCPYLISQAVANHNRTFIPKDPDLTVGVDVTFSPTALTFTSCCTKHSKPSRTLKLNPLGDASVDSWDVRSDATPVPDFMALGFYAQMKNFTGKTFTLLCVDPDVPRSTAGTQDRPLLHWMVVNIPEGRMAEGYTAQSYIGPRPPDAAHYYYFLLYEQNDVINTNETGNYTIPTNSRFLFDISNFVSDNSLRLVGVNWFIAEPDEYTRYTYAASGGNVTSLCAGQSNFATPCPVSGSAHWQLTFTQIFMLNLISIFLSSI